MYIDICDKKKLLKHWICSSYTAPIKGTYIIILKSKYLLAISEYIYVNTFWILIKWLI